MLADNGQRTCLAPAEAGYLTKRTTVLAVAVSDAVGGLAGPLDAIENADLNID